jgi:hypothetical protein
MTEKTAPAAPEAETPEVEVVVEPNFLVKLGTKYPRASRAAAIIVAGTAVVGGATVLRTASKNKHHIDNAKDHALEAGSELSQAVSPTPETDNA